MKSYEQVTEQLASMQVIAWKAEQLTNETYQDISWEDWAYLMVETPYWVPRVICFSEQAVTVVSNRIIQLVTEETKEEKEKKWEERNN
jgi:hypothetical protein